MAGGKERGMTRIHLASVMEGYDLAAWLSSHADEPDMPAKASEAAAWLVSIAENMARTGANATHVPADFVAAVHWAVDDWTEVLAAHGDSLATTV
jgi:hypothetical protein